MKNKQVTEKQLVDAMDAYIDKLADTKSVSPTKLNSMQQAIYGCKMIVRNAFGSKQKMENAKIR